MPGTHVFTSQNSGWVAATCLRLLTNMLVCAEYGNNQYEKEFDKEFAVGDRIEVKYPDEGTIRDGLAYVGTPVDRRSTSITVDQVFGSDVNWDSLEKALQMERSKKEIEDQIIRPRIAKVSQEIDSRFAAFAARNTPNVVGALGTTPSSLATYSAARTRMMELATWNPAAKKAMIVTPQMMEGIASLSAFQSLFHPATEVEKAWKTGAIGTYGGWRWFESMSLLRQTASTWAGTVETDGASQAGSSILLTCTTGDTFTKGDKITFENVYAVNPMTKQSTGRLRQFVITQSTVGASSAATIQIAPAIVGPGSPYQNVNALPADDADLTLWPGTSSPNAKAGPCGLAISSEAFALVGVKLPMPTQGQELAIQMTDPDSGISISIIREFDFNSRSWKTRIDVLLGFGVLRSDACVAIASAA